MTDYSYKSSDSDSGSVIADMYSSTAPPVVGRWTALFACGLIVDSVWLITRGALDGIFSDAETEEDTRADEAAAQIGIGAGVASFVVLLLMDICDWDSYT